MAHHSDNEEEVTVLQPSRTETPPQEQASPPPVDPRVLHYLTQLSGSSVPDNLHQGLALYLALGYLPGSFLTAVLSGDQASAIRRADDRSRAAYGELLLWLARRAPAESWGSDENVIAWRERLAPERQRREGGTQS